MRIATIIVLFGLMLAGTAFAGDDGNGCKLQGTWIGETPYPSPDNIQYMLKFFSVFHGTGDTVGTEVTEWINPVPDPGTAWSNPRGVWEKSGPKQYKYTKRGYIYAAANGAILVVVKHTGTFTLVDCNTLVVDTNVEYFTYPDMIPIMCQSARATLQRVLLEEDACQQ